MESNVAELCGVVLSEPKFSHKTYGEIFYTFELGIERRSGYIDEIRIMISERLIFDHTPRLKDFVEIKGQIRTYNELAENHNKLHIVVFAKEIYFSENFGYNENYIYLEGFLCKPPLKRTSPLGREICDLMLAVNRMYNRRNCLSPFPACRSWRTAAPKCARRLRFPSSSWRKGDFVSCGVLCFVIKYLYCNIVCPRREAGRGNRDWREIENVRCERKRQQHLQCR